MKNKTNAASDRIAEAAKRLLTGNTPKSENKARKKRSINPISIKPERGLSPAHALKP